MFATLRVSLLTPKKYLGHLTFQMFDEFSNKKHNIEEFISYSSYEAASKAQLTSHKSHVVAVSLRFLSTSSSSLSLLLPLVICVIFQYTVISVSRLSTLNTQRQRTKKIIYSKQRTSTITAAEIESHPNRVKMAESFDSSTS